jgi:hypothetical protein
MKKNIIKLGSIRGFESRLGVRSLVLKSKYLDSAKSYRSNLMNPIKSSLNVVTTSIVVCRFALNC